MLRKIIYLTLFSLVFLFAFSQNSQLPSTLTHQIDQVQVVATSSKRRTQKGRARQKGARAKGARAIELLARKK